MQSPSAGRKHAADQNTERDVIEDMTENVHWRRPRHAQNSRLSGCQCDGAPWLIAAPAALVPIMKWAGSGTAVSLVFQFLDQNQKMAAAKRTLAAFRPLCMLPLGPFPSHPESDGPGEVAALPSGARDFAVFWKRSRQCGGLHRIV